MAMTFAQMKENKLIRRITLIGSVCGALITIYNFGDVWDKVGITRPVFVHEYQQTVYHITQDLRNLEMDYRHRSIMYDQKTLREIDTEIADRVNKSHTVPSTLLDVKQIIEDSLNNHRARLKVLEDNKSD
jgi:hypothetical protein